MSRRDLFALLGGLITWPLAARARQPAPTRESSKAFANAGIRGARSLSFRGWSAP